MHDQYFLFQENPARQDFFLNDMLILEQSVLFLLLEETEAKRQTARAVEKSVLRTVGRAHRRIKERICADLLVFLMREKKKKKFYRI